ncbi:hypothetical protein DFJ58DRAFT_750606 [Suillus subalutaceus]|uniref:uncharacterized protein n=1 Tax=Suillus subalutaceus TaxID=48586 RepID=UPI001B8639D5|nr:uncharacterized protein DFJ58DRAFT_750606 [Suillus subalutaceus]KAG1830061.1 hypothetical protein DFJ58DRAFT_750606 [Suillus subalutaceus]
MAVVDNEQADEAAKAFRAVAYRRLGSSVVYLEKGNSDRTLITAFKSITIAKQEAGSGADADELSLSAGTTLFVKNLAFSATAERLVRVFRGFSGSLVRESNGLSLIPNDLLFLVLKPPG